jgi:hypothetical protein
MPEFELYMLVDSTKMICYNDVIMFWCDSTRATAQDTVLDGADSVLGRNMGAGTATK